MTQRTSKQHVRNDIEKIIRARRGKTRSTNQNRKMLMYRISGLVLGEFHLRPSAWQQEQVEWLWEHFDHHYSERTSYLYRTVTREILEFYGQWSYLPDELTHIPIPNRNDPE